MPEIEIPEPGTREHGKFVRGLFPGGRFIYYEGDTPDDFIEEVKAATGGFDPSTQATWGEYIPYGEQRLWNDPPGFHSYGFECPPEHLPTIYYGRWPMGS